MKVWIRGLEEDFNSIERRYKGFCLPREKKNERTVGSAARDRRTTHPAIPPARPERTMYDSDCVSTVPGAAFGLIHTGKDDGVGRARRADLRSSGDGKHRQTPAHTPTTMSAKPKQQQLKGQQGFCPRQRPRTADLASRRQGSAVHEKGTLYYSM